MKKTIVWMIALSLLVLLSACGTNNNNSTGDDVNTIEENINNDVQEENGVNEEEEEEENNTANEVNNTEGNAPGNEENANEENETTNNDNESGNDNDNVITEEVEQIDSVTLYFSDDQLLHTFRVDSGVSVPANEDGALEALNLWLDGPSQEGLISILPEGVSIESVAFEDNGVAYVSFSSSIAETNLGSSGELMFTEQVAMMMEQFGYGHTFILIAGDEVDEFLGHMDLSEPIEAGNPDDYETME